MRSVASRISASVVGASGSSASRVGGERVGDGGLGDLGPEVLFGGVQSAGDLAAVAGVGGAAGEPATDGSDVDLHDVCELLWLQAGVLERCAKLVVGHLGSSAIACGRAENGVYASKMSEDVRGRLGRCPAMPLRSPCGWAHRVGMLHANGTIATVHPEDRAGGGLTREDVMTAGEVAELLALPVSTVYHLARQGPLPACRLGRTWRFLRPRIEELLRA